VAASLTATEWRDFWRERGERELTLLLWARWRALPGSPTGAYVEHATRIATLLGSRAGSTAVEAELGRMREGLGAPADPAADGEAATTIAAWFAEVGAA
jgi:hypothetical protein